MKNLPGHFWAFPRHSNDVLCRCETIVLDTPPHPPRSSALSMPTMRRSKTASPPWNPAPQDIWNKNNFDCQSQLFSKHIGEGKKMECSPHQTLTPTRQPCLCWLWSSSMFSTIEQFEFTSVVCLSKIYDAILPFPLEVPLLSNFRRGIGDKNLLAIAQ